MKYCFLGLFLLLFSQLSFGQTKEAVSFSIPKTIYFGGEKVWIAGEVAQEGLEEKSVIFYAELINRYNESVAIAKMPLENGKSFNFLSLPESLPSDNYLLRVFTRISPYQDLETGISQQLITVFNRQYPPTVISDRKKANPSSANTQLFSIPKDKFTSGEMLQVNLSDPASVEEIHIGVYNPFLEKQGMISSSEIYESIDSKEVVPELFGHVIEANVTKEIVDTTQLYFISIHGKKSALFTDRPDENGKMFFDAGGIRNWNYLVAQANNNKSLIDFNIISPAPKTHFKKSFTIPELEISPSDEPYLKELLKGGLVEGYYVNEFDTSDFPVITGFVEDRAYNLDDYTRFESVETVIKEYVPEVSVKSVQKKKEFRVVNAIRSFAFENNPLMLIDAMPVFDSDQLAAFDPKEFKSLEILTRLFFLNEEEFPGVISFTSYKNDFGGYPIPTNGIFQEYQGIQPKIQSAQNLFDSPGSESDIMDWRTILFWSKTPGSQELSNTVEIKVPELKGLYLVTLKSNGNSYSKVIQVN